MGKIVNRYETQVVDGNTGEALGVTLGYTYVDKVNKEPFFLTFSKHMSILYDLKKLSSVKVLWKFLEMSEYNTNRVYVPFARKSEIIRELGISLPTYNVALRELKDAGIISGSNGCYVLDEGLHWRGNFETRDKLMKAHLKLTVEADYEDGKA